MQYKRYDQITTELYPDYMHMTGNQLDDALQILMISQQNSKKQQQLMKCVETKPAQTTQHQLDLSLVKQSQTSALTALLGKSNTNNTATDKVQKPSHTQGPSIYERLYAQASAQKRQKQLYNTSARPRTPKEIPLQLTEPTLSQQAARLALQQKCREEIENQLKEKLRRPQQIPQELRGKVNQQARQVQEHTQKSLEQKRELQKLQQIIENTQKESQLQKRANFFLAQRVQKIQKKMESDKQLKQVQLLQNTNSQNPQQVEWTKRFTNMQTTVKQLHKKIRELNDQKQQMTETLDAISKNYKEYMSEKQRLDKELTPFEKGRPNRLKIIADIEFEYILSNVFLQEYVKYVPAPLANASTLSTIHSERSSVTSFQCPQQVNDSKDYFATSKLCQQNNVQSSLEQQRSSTTEISDSSDCVDNISKLSDKLHDTTGHTDQRNVDNATAQQKAIHEQLQKCSDASQNNNVSDQNTPDKDNSQPDIQADIPSDQPKQNLQSEQHNIEKSTPNSNGSFPDLPEIEQKSDMPPLSDDQTAKEPSDFLPPPPDTQDLEEPFPMDLPPE